MHTVATYFVFIILISISGRIQHKRVGEGLIENTGLTYYAQSSTEISSTNTSLPTNPFYLTRCKRCYNVFLELLKVSGGDINISKCACFTVCNIWCGGRASLLKIKASHPLMYITHPHTGETKNIVKKDPNQAHRALGWMMTTDGKSKSQFTVLKQIAKLFAGSILHSRMQR
jgi:hypothetical protein